MNKSFAAKVLTVAVSLVVSASVPVAVYELEVNRVQIYCQKEVGTDSCEIKKHISTVGAVSDSTIEKAAELIKTSVSHKAWNYLVSSGGKLIIVEGSDIKGYVNENYKANMVNVKPSDTILGYCPRFSTFLNVLSKVDVVVASESLTSLPHEFGHVLDYTCKYSDSERFKEIYSRANSICSKLVTLDDGATISQPERFKQYYSGDIKEFFAEMYSQYKEGNLIGVDAELEAFMYGV